MIDHSFDFLKFICISLAKRIVALFLNCFLVVQLIVQVFLGIMRLFKELNVFPLILLRLSLIALFIGLDSRNVDVILINGFLWVFINIGDVVFFDDFKLVSFFLAYAGNSSESIVVFQGFLAFLLEVADFLTPHHVALECFEGHVNK